MSRIVGGYQLRKIQRSRSNDRQPTADDSDDEPIMKRLLEEEDVSTKTQIKRKVIVDDIETSSDSDDESLPDSDDKVSSSSSSSSDDSSSSSDDDFLSESDESSAGVHIDEESETLDSQDSTSDQYYQEDRSLLRSILEKRLKKSFPLLGEEEISKAIEQTLKDADVSLIEEYCGAVPKDERWKVGLSDEEITRLEEVLKTTRQEIDAEEPTMKKILSLKMTLEQRKRMIQLYDVYMNIEPYTMEHYEHRQAMARELKEIEIANIDVDVEERLAEQERMLRGKIALQTTDEALRKKILLLDASEEVKARLIELYHKYVSSPGDSETRSNLLSKLTWAVSLPYKRLALPPVQYGVSTAAQINSYCAGIRKVLDTELYGMERVKDELLIMLNNRVTNPRATSIIALKGPPGVGKTAIVAALANATGLPFERIALGGMEDVTHFKGSDTHWVGSGPSIILRLLSKMKIGNGILFFDEVDKIKGDAVQDALLHITDYTQNHQFCDMYLSDYPHDISNLMFVFAMNDDRWISPILRDRLYIVDVERYKPQELREIIRRHLIPKAVKKVDIEPEMISVDDSGCREIMRMAGITEGGVRQIGMVVDTIISRINLLRTITLEDGTTGDLRPRYALPNFSLPMVITEDVVKRLYDRPTPVDTGPAGMYS